MLLSSMTGFARKSGHSESGEVAFDWAWEIKSVNGKGLDVKTRLPGGIEEISFELKNIAQKFFERGSLSVCLELNGSQKEPKLKINHDLLQQATAAAIELYRKNPDFIRPPAASELLQITGVAEVENGSHDEEAMQALRADLLAGFAECCAALQADRQKEGQKIKAVLAQMVDKIAKLTDDIAAIAAGAPQALRQKLQQQIAELAGEECGISEERLAQEVVLLVNRADIREEIDRLHAHIKTARQLLESGQTLGRRFDFLCQEFNRETNTTCSKAFDIEIINRGMELKAVIEQLREQVQNME